MAQHTLFQSDTTLITPKIARFGVDTFQISTISSVSLSETRRVNRLAVIAGLIGLVGLAVGVLTYERNQEQSVIALIVGAAALVAAFMIQQIWPLMEFKLLLRLTSGETHTITVNDKALSEQLRAAIEEAFTLRP
jgi:Family of unknown function (DUF6232)